MFWSLRYRFPAQYHLILTHFEVGIVVVSTSLGKLFCRYKISGVLFLSESNSYLEHHVNIRCQSVGLLGIVPAITKSDLIRIFSSIKALLRFLVFSQYRHLLLLPQGEITKGKKKGVLKSFQFLVPRTEWVTTDLFYYLDLMKFLYLLATWNPHLFLIRRHLFEWNFIIAHCISHVNYFGWPTGVHSVTGMVKIKQQKFWEHASYCSSGGRGWPSSPWEKAHCWVEMWNTDFKFLLCCFQRGARACISHVPQEYLTHQSFSYSGYSLLTKCL